MSDVNDFLAHYGVKGMKWGVRKAASSVGSGISKAATGARDGVRDAIRRSREKRAATKAERQANHEAARKAGYSPRMRGADMEILGSRVVRRIEKRVADGENVGKARIKESAASTARGLLVGTAILATPIAIGAADRGLSNLASSIQAKRGAEAAANIFADNKGLTSYKTVALAFDSATGKWV